MNSNQVVDQSRPRQEISLAEAIQAIIDHNAPKGYVIGEFTCDRIDKLSADGNGGLQVDKENGQTYWIVQLDTVNKTITILL